MVHVIGPPNKQDLMPQKSVDLIPLPFQSPILLFFNKTPSIPNLSNPTCTGNKILCQNRQGVRLHNGKHIKDGQKGHENQPVITHL